MKKKSYIKAIAMGILVLIAATLHLVECNPPEIIDPIDIGVQNDAG